MIIPFLISRTSKAIIKQHECMHCSQLFEKAKFNAMKTLLLSSLPVLLLVQDLCTAIPLNDFYEFGDNTSDSQIPMYVEGNPVQDQFRFPFYGNVYSQLRVSGQF